ncbi:MAG: hypothetical protein QM749_14470 [Aquabacterium sp.]
MKHISLTWALGASLLAASGAQAEITQIPTGPTQVRLSWASTVTDYSLGDNLGPPEPLSIDLVASGNAHIEPGKTWVADVTDVTDSLIRVGGDNAGLTINETGAHGNDSDTWKDLTINLSTKQVTGDRYVDGLLVANDERIFYFSDLSGQWAKPEGQSMLWRGLYVGNIDLVSSVPEPASSTAMALGLLAMGWGVRRAGRRA